MSLRKAKFQKAVDFVLFLPICGWLLLFLKYGCRYRIEGLREIREEFKELMKDPRPLMICSNHLTYIDSALIIHALGNHFWYLRHFRCLSWNLPAAEYSRQPFFRLVCFLVKCIFIDRKGTREHHQSVLETARALLLAGEPVTIFPEGRRSRTGRFDDQKPAYGIGKVISGMRECRVLCLYLRGDRQGGPSKFPARGSRFRIRGSLLHFERSLADGPGFAEITRQISAEIARLEERHFAARPQSPSLPSAQEAGGVWKKPLTQ